MTTGTMNPFEEEFAVLNSNVIALMEGDLPLEFRKAESFLPKLLKVKQHHADNLFLDQFKYTIVPKESAEQAIEVKPGEDKSNINEGKENDVVSNGLSDGSDKHAEQETNVIKEENDSSATPDKKVAEPKSSIKIKTHFPSNKEILELVREMDPLVCPYYEHLDTVRTWLELKKGKFETGHSFGSEVIEEILKKLKTFEGLGFRSGNKSYLEQRIKYCQDIEKDSGLDDAVRSVELLDRQFLQELVTVIRDMQSNYLIVYDLLRKNWTTIMNAGGYGGKGSRKFEGMF